MPGGLNEVSQQVSADASRYIAEYRAALAVTKELNAANKELQQTMGGAGFGAGAVAEVAKINAAIREQQALLASHQSVLGNVASATAGFGAAHTAAAAQVTAAAAAVRDHTGSVSDLSAGYEQARSTIADMAADALRQNEQMAASFERVRSTSSAGSDSVLSYYKSLGLIRDTAKETTSALADTAAAVTAVQAASGSGGGSATSSVLGDVLASRVLSGLTAGGGASGGGTGSGGGGFFGGAAGAAAGDVGGSLKNVGTQWANLSSIVAPWLPRIHYAIMGLNEVMATVGPAVVAGGAAAAVMTQGAQQAYNRLVAINAVGQSLGPSLGMTGGSFVGGGQALQQAQNIGGGGAYELLGAGINVAKGSAGGAFTQLGLNTEAMLDRASATITQDFQSGLGTKIAGVVSGGTGYLQQLGDVLGNVGDTFMNVAPNLPGVGGDYLSTLQGATKGLSSVTGWLGGGLQPILAAEAAARIGAPLVLGPTQALLGKAGIGLAGIGDRLAASSLPGTDALASIVGESGVGLAEMGGGIAALTAPEVAGLGAAAMLIGKSVTYQTPAQQQASQLQAAVNQGGLLTGIAPIISGLQTEAKVPAGAAPPTGALSFFQQGGPGQDIADGLKGLAKGLGSASPSGMWSGLVQAGHGVTNAVGGLLGIGPGRDPTNYQAAQQAMDNMSHTFVNLLNAGGQVQGVWDGISHSTTSMASAFNIATMAQLQLGSAFSKNGQLTSQAKTMIGNLYAGYAPMMMNSGQFGDATAAGTAMQGLNATKVGDVNSSFDQLTSLVQGGAAAASTYFGLLGGSPVGSTKSKAAGIALTAPPSKSGFANALGSFTSSTGAAAWNELTNTSSGVFPALEQQMDWLREAQTMNALGPGQTTSMSAYEIGQALPMLGRNPAALSMLSSYAQQFGGPTFKPGTSGTTMQRALAQWVQKNGLTNSAYNSMMTQGTETLAQTGTDAQQFVQTTQQNVVPGLAQGVATYGSGLQTAFMEAAAKGGNITAPTDAYLAFLKKSGVPEAGALDMAQYAAGLGGAKAPALASLKQQVDLTYSTPKPPDLPSVQWNSVIGTPKVPPVPSIPPVLINSKVNVPALPPVPHPGTVNFPSAVTKPIPPPPPPGGTVKYTSSVTPPVAPPAPRGGVIVYTTTVVGPGPMTAPNSGAGGTATVIGGVGNVRLRSQTGGLVPGAGSGDIVPAMLEPGEAIIPKYLVPLLAPILAAHRVPGFGAPASGASHFAAGGLVDAGLSASQIQAQINAAYNTLDTMTQGSTASNAFWKNTLDPLYAALDALKGKATSTATAVKAATSTGTGTGGGTSLGWTLTGQQGQAPLPAAVQSVIDNLLSEVAKSNIGKQFAVTLAGQFNSSIKNLPAETKSIASSLVSQIGTEVGYAKNVSSAAQLGQGYGTQGLISGMDVDPATGNGSVFSQMQSYLGSEQGFTSDLKTLTKDGLSKGIASQMIAAGPVQGDALAQSILGDYGGVQGVNKLWAQIGTASKALGAQSAMSQYGGKLSPDLTSGTFVSNNVSISVSAENNDTLNLTAAQITSLTEQIQAKLLQQAKRNPKTGLKLTGKGS